jgi:hypothetical protein
VGNAQNRVLNSLLNDSRMNRLLEGEALATIDRRDAYSLGDMLDGLRGGIWSELNANSVTIDPFRRRLQNQLITTMGSKINPPAPAAGAGGGGGGGAAPAPLSEDARSQIRGELVTLRDEIRRAVAKAADRETRLHLQGAEHRITEILEPRK